MAFDTDTSTWNLFGFQIKKKDKPEPESFVPKSTDDGTAISSYVDSAAAYNSYSIDLDPSAVKNEQDLIRKYREIALIADIDVAVDEIVNEAVIYGDFTQPIELDFTEEFSKTFSLKTKQTIIDEYKYLLGLMNFNSLAHEYFRNFYIDGRISFHKIIDPDSPKNGIIEIRPIDCINIKKINDIKKEKDPNTGIDLIVSQNEYFVYSQAGFNGNNQVGIKISKDAITYATSGLTDTATNNTLSYLHKAIRPLNQLRMIEDSEVIYRLVRAPERRVFYIDTSGMARTKAEQYIKDVMARYKNKQVYDASTGTLRDDKKHLTMLEDFWLPRANGGKGTEITTLPGGQGLGSIDSVNYFQNKLYQSLNIPLSRLQLGQGQFNLGRSSEITRDEVKFMKFIDKLRRKFNNIFLDILKTQLILKGITTQDDWEQIKQEFTFKYSQDNFYAELKESDMFRERMQNLQMADAYVGKYFSGRYIQRNILKMTDGDVENMDEEIREETPAEPAQGTPEQDEQGTDQQQNPEGATENERNQEYH